MYRIYDCAESRKELIFQIDSMATFDTKLPACQMTLNANALRANR